MLGRVAADKPNNRIPADDRRISADVHQPDLTPLRQHSEANAKSGKLLYNADGSVSSVRSGSVQVSELNNGKPTLIPFIYDGRLVDVNEAIDRAIKSGITWPAFDTNEEASIASQKLSASFDTQQETQRRIHDSQLNPSDPEFFDAIKENLARIAKKLKPFGEGSRGSVAAEVVVKTPPTVVGATEFIAMGASDLAGSLAGFIRTGGEAILDTTNEASKMMFRRVLGVGDKPERLILDSPMIKLARKFHNVVHDRLLENINYHREQFRYKPWTDTGKSLTNMFGAGFEQIAELGQEAGDAVMEKTNNPAMATAARILPEATIMLGTLRLGAEKTNKIIKATEELVHERMTKGVGHPDINVFDHKVTAEFPSLRPEEVIRRDKIRKDIADLEAIPAKERSKAQEQILDKLRKENEIIKIKEFRVEDQYIDTLMKPEEVLEMATEAQMKKYLSGEQVILKGSKRTEPIELIRDGPDLRIVTDIVPRKTVTKVEQPTIITKADMVSGTVFHTVRDAVDIKSIIQEGLRKESNISKGDGSQGLSGPIVLVFDEARVSSVPKSYRPEEGLVSKQTPIKPKAILIDADEIGATPKIKSFNDITNDLIALDKKYKWKSDKPGQAGYDAAMSVGSLSMEVKWHGGLSKAGQTEFAKIVDKFGKTAAEDILAIAKDMAESEKTNGVGSVSKSMKENVADLLGDDIPNIPIYKYTLDDAGKIATLAPLTIKTVKATKAQARNPIADVYMAHILGNKKIPVHIRQRKVDPKTLEKTAMAVQKFEADAAARQAAITAGGKRTVGEWLAERWWDKSAPMKRRLINQMGDRAKRAIMVYDLLSGASTAARLSGQKYMDTIFNNFSESKIALTFPLKDIKGKAVKLTEEQVLDQIVFSRLIRSIGRRKKGRTGPGNYGEFHHGARLEDLYNRLGRTEYERYNKAADQVFAAHKEMLDFGYTEGIISKSTYEKIKNFDYEPLRYMELIDPAVSQSVPSRGPPVTVRDSGVFPLKERGPNKASVMSARELLLSNILSTHARVFKNRANLELEALAKEFPKNSIVRTVADKKQVKPGMGYVEYFKDGEKFVLELDPNFASMWTQSVSDMSTFITNFVRWGVGTPIVKGTAVGFNPAFFLVDFPRNIGHMMLAGRRDYLTGNKLYSSFIPKYAGEVIHDMASIWHDAVHKTGFFEQLANSGAFPQFLAHIGKEMVEKAPNTHQWLIDTVGHKAGNQMGRALSWINEFSEILMRMAAAKRAMREQAKRGETPDITAAAYEARRIIDYGQSGRWGKAVDHVVPFFNPAVQAMRTGTRGMKEDPLGSAWIYTQAIGGAYVLAQWNYQSNPDAAAAIADDDMVSGINIVMPTAMNGTDKEGNLVYPYIHIPVENLFMPVLAGVNYINRYKYEGRRPSRYLRTIARHFLPITPTSGFPPIADAIVKMSLGDDIWFDKKLYEDETVAMWAQYYDEHDRRQTPPLYVELGRTIYEITGNPNLLSPARMQGVVDSYVADHPISKAWNEYIQTKITGTPKFHQRRSAWDMLKSQPFLGKLLRVGRTSVNAFSDLEDIRTSTSTQRKLANDQLDKLMIKIRDERVSVDTALKFLADNPNTPPDEINRLKKRFGATLKYNEIAKGWTEETRRGIPGLSWWQSVATMLPADRAAAYYSWWSRVGSGKRKQLKRIAMAMPGFYGRTFGFHLHELQSYHGKDLPPKGRDWGVIDFYKEDNIDWNTREVPDPEYLGDLPY